MEAPQTPAAPPVDERKEAAARARWAAWLCSEMDDRPEAERIGVREMSRRTGASRNLVSLWRRGTFPSLFFARRIAVALGRTVEEVANAADDPTVPDT